MRTYIDKKDTITVQVHDNQKITRLTIIAHSDEEDNPIEREFIVDKLGNFEIIINPRKD